MRRLVPVFLLVLLAACGDPSPGDDLGRDEGVSEDTVLDIAADDAEDVESGHDGTDSFDPGFDSDVVDDVESDVPTDSMDDADASDLPDVPMVCTELTVMQDCAAECADLDQCQACVCNTGIPGGRCEVVPADGAACEDGENCTRDDYCENGTCLPGRLACDCIDDDGCAVMEDGNLCNGTLYCNKSVFPYSCDLDPLTIITCPTNQDTQCLKNQCEPASGECAMLPASEGQSCTYVSICVLQATCQEGMCAPFVTRNCDDENECTDDVCVEEFGCVRTNNSSPCDDGSVCTLDDTCIDGACGHLNVLDCDNDVFCDGVELCDPVLGCQAGTPPTCDDGNVCTRDRCLDFYDECFNDWIETAVEGPRGALSCQDGVDNDCDGETDISDPECLLGLDRVEPNDGVMAGGDVVVLTGNELDEVATVLFGTRQAQIVEQSSLSMTVVSPAGQTPGPVSVVVSSGLASYTMVNGFTYTASAPIPGGECTLQFPDSALERDVGASIVVMTGESIVPTTTPSEMVMFSFGYGPRGSNPSITAGWIWTDAGVTGQEALGAATRTSWSVFPVAERGGYFDVAARLSTDGGVHWVLCDLDGSANGYVAEQAPDLTVYGNAEPGDVIINEMMWPGTAADANDEWIELRNLGVAPVRLSGWKISGVGYPSGQDFIFDSPDRVVNNDIIDGGGYYLISQFDRATSAIDVEPDMVAQSSSSSSRTLRLANVGPRTYNLIDDRGIIIDSAYFSASFGMIGSVPFNEPYQSMERREGFDSGSTDAAWQSAWVSEGFDGDPFQTMLTGTPRGPNSGIVMCTQDSHCAGFHPELTIGLCQTRVCDTVNGRCDIVDIQDGGACEDGLFCTVGETCLSMVCGNSLPRDCSDSGTGSLCTFDSCDEEADTCVHEPDPDVREGPADSFGCRDLVDNDCDGLTDGIDPQCRLDVTSISPVVVPQDASVDSWVATISGVGFQSVTVTAVAFRGPSGVSESAVFSVESDTSISVMLPSVSEPGLFDVLVSDGLVSAELSDAISFQGTATDLMAIISSPTDDLSVRVNQSTVFIKGRVKGAAIGTGSGMILPSLIVAELGYGPELADPSTDHGWTWLAATHDSTCVDCVDEYQFRRTLSIPATGVYALAYRFSVDGGVSWAWGAVGPPYSTEPWDPMATITVTVIP